MKPTDTAKIIRELRASLQLIRADHQYLARRCRKFKDSKKHSKEPPKPLLKFAEKQRVAAKKFSGFKIAKKLERDSINFCERAPAIASLLEAPAQEDAA
ncbi:hypothetical protein M5G24_16845 [Pseudomonas sp. TNT2022 ID1048]|uniref:hypothetical protein n=1 Tax=Pseudomonas idahonensis TaxID=2942628 RepID=UPI002360EC50|nr:hypothetical protein [Pseudomonas idahonensis]MDD1020679.1 hypothetical protein [Pseudomonas idahonensis]